MDGPNWGLWFVKLQAAARILDIWDVLRGEVLTTNPTMYNLFTKPTPLATTLAPTATELAAYEVSKTLWKKKNAQALGLMQASVAPVIWQDYLQIGVAKDLLNALEAAFGAAGGATMYLPMVNMVKIQFTISMDLLPQMQDFQDNYDQITSNGHSRLSEDLATFMFCSSLPKSYEQTTWQYLDNIMVIANYKLMDIITQVLQEES